MYISRPEYATIESFGPPTERCKYCFDVCGECINGFSVLGLPRGDTLVVSRDPHSCSPLFNRETYAFLEAFVLAQEVDEG